PIVIDGHDITAIDRAFGGALSNTGKPTVIIAKTVKGKGFSEIENKDGWHGKALPPDMAERAIKELGGVRHLKVKTSKPESGRTGRPRWRSRTSPRCARSIARPCSTRAIRTRRPSSRL